MLIKRTNKTKYLRILSQNYNETDFFFSGNDFSNILNHSKLFPERGGRTQYDLTLSPISFLFSVHNFFLFPVRTKIDSGHSTMKLINENYKNQRNKRSKMKLKYSRHRHKVRCSHKIIIMINKRKKETKKQNYN